MEPKSLIDLRSQIEHLRTQLHIFSLQCDFWDQSSKSCNLYWDVIDIRLAKVKLKFERSTTGNLLEGNFGDELRSERYTVAVWVTGGSAKRTTFTSAQTFGSVRSLYDSFDYPQETWSFFYSLKGNYLAALATMYLVPWLPFIRLFSLTYPCHS